MFFLFNGKLLNFLLYIKLEIWLSFFGIETWLPKVGYFVVLIPYNRIIQNFKLLSYSSFGNWFVISANFIEAFSTDLKFVFDSNFVPRIFLLVCGLHLVFVLFLYRSCNPNKQHLLFLASFS